MYASMGNKQFDFWCWKMTLKVRILQSFRRLFIILLSLTMTLFSEKMLISNICVHGLMPNLIENSWTVSILHIYHIFRHWWSSHSCKPQISGIFNPKLISCSAGNTANFVFLQRASLTVLTVCCRLISIAKYETPQM